MGLIAGSGRSPREGNGNPLQYSCLGNPMDRGAWWATVHGIPKSWTLLSCFWFGSVSSFFLELVLHWSLVAYWAPTDLESSSGSCDGTQAWLRGATPRLRSGQKPREPHAQGVAAKRSYPASEVRAAARRSYPRPRPRAAAGRSYLMPKVSGGSREEQPHVQGAVAAQAQDGLEELLHIQGQEGRRWGYTLHPR